VKGWGRPTGKDVVSGLVTGPRATWRRRDDGRWLVADLPESVPSHAVTALADEGLGFFAAVARLDESWPRTDETRGAALVLSVRTVSDVPSATFVKAVVSQPKRLGERDNLLLLSGVSSPVVLEALEEAVARGEQWVADHDDRGART